MNQQSRKSQILTQANTALTFIKTKTPPLFSEEGTAKWYAYLLSVTLDENTVLSESFAKEVIDLINSHSDDLRPDELKDVDRVISEVFEIGNPYFIKMITSRLSVALFAGSLQRLMNSSRKWSLPLVCAEYLQSSANEDNKEKLFNFLRAGYYHIVTMDDFRRGFDEQILDEMITHSINALSDPDSTPALRYELTRFLFEALELEDLLTLCEINCTIYIARSHINGVASLRRLVLLWIAAFNNRSLTPKEEREFDLQCAKLSEEDRRVVFNAALRSIRDLTYQPESKPLPDSYYQTLYLLIAHIEPKILNNYTPRKALPLLCQCSDTFNALLQGDLYDIPDTHLNVFIHRIKELDLIEHLASDKLTEAKKIAVMESLASV